jgi:Transposase, Mutator family
VLVMVGVRLDGTKELVAIRDGYRESKESWADLLRDLKRRGMPAPGHCCVSAKRTRPMPLGEGWDGVRTERVDLLRSARIAQLTAATYRGAGARAQCNSAMASMVYRRIGLRDPDSPFSRDGGQHQVSTSARQRGYRRERCAPSVYLAVLAPK